MSDLHSCCQRVLLDHYSVCSARSQPVEGPTPEVRVTRYEVSCIPRNHEDASLFTLAVQLCWHGRWAVMCGSTLHHDADGSRSHGVRWEDDREPVTDEDHASYDRAYEGWLDRFHFAKETALEVARRLAPQMRYRGYTVADALVRAEASDA